MDVLLGVFIVIVLLIISLYTLYQEASFWNLISSFLLLSFTAYFTIYILDVSTE